MGKNVRADRAEQADGASAPGPERASPGLAKLGEPSEGQLQAAAEEIRRFTSTSMLRYAATVGGIVLERFYGGDRDAWRSHAAKGTSLRRLSERLGEETRLSASGLYRCIGVHLVVRRLGSFDRWDHLLPTHVVAVLPLAEERQITLLRRAQDERWSLRRLQKEVRGFGNQGRTGRPPTPGFVKAIRQIQRLAAEKGPAFSELDRAASMDPRDVEELSSALMLARAQLERLQRALSVKRLRAIKTRDDDGGGPIPQAG